MTLIKFLRLFVMFWGRFSGGILGSVVGDPVISLNLRLLGRGCVCCCWSSSMAYFSCNGSRLVHLEEKQNKRRAHEAEEVEKDDIMTTLNAQGLRWFEPPNPSCLPTE